MVSDSDLEILRILRSEKNQELTNEDVALALAKKCSQTRDTIRAQIYRLSKDGLVEHNGRRGRRGKATKIRVRPLGQAVLEAAEDSGWVPPGSNKIMVERMASPIIESAGEPSGPKSTDIGKEAVLSQEDTSGYMSLHSIGDGLLNNQPVGEEDRSGVRLGSIETRVELLIELLKLYGGKWITPDLPALNAAAKALGVDATHLFPAVKQAIVQGKIIDNSKGSLRATAYWLPEAEVRQLPPPIPYGHKTPKTKCENQRAETAAYSPKFSPTHDDMSNVGRVMWSLWIIGAGATLSTLIALVNNRKPSLSPGEIEEALNTLVGSSRATKHIAPDSKYIYWNPVR